MSRKPGTGAPSRFSRPISICFAIAFLAVLPGCKGDAGPMGPAGPAGPQGPPGPAGASGATNRADLSGVFTASGTATGLLPAASVAGGKVPAISCYTSDDGTAWLAVAQIPATSTDTYCGLTGIGTASPGITILNGITGWRYYLIAVW